MEKRIILILLLSIACLKTFGQSNDLLPDLKYDRRLVLLLDSARKVPIDIQKKEIPVTFNSRPANGQQPLFLIKTHHNIFILDSIQVFSPDWLQTMYVVDKQKLIKYGSNEKKGIVLITINDKKYPKAYKIIKSTSKRFEIPKTN